MNQEQNWKPIPNYEHYLVSDCGLIFNTKRDKIKKSCPDKKGYMRVRLLKNNKGITKKVHRLVAQAFLIQYSEKLQVNHINFIKSDNRIENLEMVTQSQNTKHAWDNKRMKLSMKGTDGKFITNAR
jgi:hypothetical protein